MWSIIPSETAHNTMTPASDMLSCLSLFERNASEENAHRLSTSSSLYGPPLSRRSAPAASSSSALTHIAAVDSKTGIMQTIAHMEVMRNTCVLGLI